MVPPLVLVVDDDFLVRLNIAATFEDAGFEAIEAGDAASALAVLAARSDVQLVCTDVHMPGDLDGIDLAIRLGQHHPTIGLVVLSACAQHGLPPGTPFLLKPFDPRGLIDLARQALRDAGHGLAVA